VDETVRVAATTANAAATRTAHCVRKEIGRRERLVGMTLLVS
jgi:hypothetical protein